ncbi:nucleotidyltransferase family protein [Paracoccus tegillarcae]|uniref:MobA-like NTP transferase domain-containing protein n=1 Tax=Paracoccus tegillarcae TaxID=1529068 RepID=A0A2K9EW78_9RHOB|nr:NTP transferase domain-containing protein [Paracoccus tegillarcae]AUH32302.1 hypothetical protein CUV01_01835 [Paracoccus tegillarcae]
MSISAPPPADVTALLLAAGASRRFGDDNKLLVPFRGKPLVGHAAQALRDLPRIRLIAVITDPQTAPYLDGFEVIRIAQGQQSDSLRAGLAAAGAPARILIVLGDMPNVTPGLLADVMAACTDEMPSASRDLTGPPMPPACFPQSWVPRIAALGGDQGAGRLIRDLPAGALIDAPGLLGDVDTLDQLSRMEKGAG